MNTTLNVYESFEGKTTEQIIDRFIEVLSLAKTDDMVTKMVVKCWLYENCGELGKGGHFGKALHDEFFGDSEGEEYDKLAIEWNRAFDTAWDLVHKPVY